MVPAYQNSYVSCSRWTPVATWLACLALLSADLHADESLSQTEPSARETNVVGAAARTRGMLLGSMIGDAAGGPLEFKTSKELAKWLPDVRAWSPDRFQQELESGRLAATFKLSPYEGIRPNVAPYGPWEKNAAAGTLTDDTRHKIALMNCLRTQLAADPYVPITQVDLARAYVTFSQSQAMQVRPTYPALAEESLREYVSAARWILGERDLERAIPPQRIWSGIGTCSGQMALPPLAAVYPGIPDHAYRAAFAIDFVDVGTAKDINSALVAGLAVALATEPSSPNARWRAILNAMKDTDPYRYRDVPFAGRQTTQWIEFAQQAAKRAGGSPAKLFEILEKEGRPRYYWDAHFTFTCALAFLEFCEYRGLESLVVALAFGHDTDSVAQVIGALAGAVYGADVFPTVARHQVTARLREDYGQDLDDWVSTLMQLSDRQRYPMPVRFIETEEAK